jgi:hypothetical protein
MAALRTPGMAIRPTKCHLQYAINGRKRRKSIMTSLTRSLADIGAALGVVGTAISSAAALRMTHRPEGVVRFPERDAGVRI